MDFSVLAPTLARFGAPMIAELLETAAGATGGPLAGLAVKGVTDFVLSKLGAAFDVASSDPAVIGDAISTAAQADPTGTQAKLQAVQDDHADLIQKAMAQADVDKRRAELDEQNVENARAMGLQLVSSGSPLQFVPVLVTVLCVAGMACVSWFILSGNMPDGVTAGRVEGFWETVATAAIFYWIGTSRSAGVRADQAIDFAHKATPPGAVVTKRAGR